jgi:hypothetical protein
MAKTEKEAAENVISSLVIWLSKKQMSYNPAVIQHHLGVFNAPSIVP